MTQESRRLSPAYAGRYPKKLRGRQAKATADAAANTVRSNTLESFQCMPVICAGGAAQGAATGTAGDTNLICTGPNVFEQNVLGTHTDVLMSYGADGLDIGSVGEAADDGSELTQGITARSKHAFTVGTDGPFYFEVQLSVEDVSGTDDCAIGFRKTEAYATAIDTYTDFAVLNIISGDIKIETALDDEATVTTDTTQNLADNGTVTLRVEVDRAGKVTYKIDGSTPTVTAAYTFNSGDVVIPFLFFLNHTDVAGAVNLKQWNCGLV